MSEQWKPVPGYGGHYEASDLGRIRVKDRVVVRKHSTGAVTSFHYAGRLLKPCATDKYGHQGVHIGVDGKRFSVAVHRMVLLAFVGPAPEGTEACHDNGVASDNRLTNLRWDTHHENNQDRKRHGTYMRGEKHHMAKLTQQQVDEMRRSDIHYEAAAARYGISRTQAHRILRGGSW
jgi:hypothetical protein